MRPGDAAGGMRAAVAAGATLLLIYALTLAPGVTFWDAGEFVAAFATLGIPHPPGTPLFVLVGRAWTWLLSPVADVAVAANLLSAVAMALAGVVSARLVARWTGRAAWGAAGALAAGTMSTVWLSATETEVYAAALCLAWLAIGAADVAGRRDEWPHTILAAYLLALSVPLHLSALVAAPAVVLLAADARDGRLHRDRLLAVSGAAAMSAGLATARWWLLVGGAVCAGAGPWLARASTGARLRAAGGMLVATALGASPVVALLVRARQYPPLDQGHPATWSSLVELVARKQYAVQGMWPRSAPWWLQVGNLLEWADWQVALGLHPFPEPSWARTGCTVAFVLLAVVGAVAHRRRDRRSWRALAVLLAASSLGVVAWLNLRAGPSYGYGILPDDAVREARERDYFFALPFWLWGVWAGVGAVVVAERAARALASARRGSGRSAAHTTAASRVAVAAGLAVAALPAALNWRAVTRRAEPEAAMPRAFATALLASAPRDAVLLLGGDVDTYVVWYEQLVRGTRPDVTPVTLPLLGAPWYRTELARRHSLLPRDAARVWEGETATMRLIVDAATARGRPVVASTGASRGKRAALGGAWVLRGAVWAREGEAPSGERLPDASLDASSDAPRVDAAASAAVAARLPATLFDPVRAGGDGVAAWVQELLRCPALGASAGGGAGRERRARAQLDSLCNRR